MKLKNLKVKGFKNLSGPDGWFEIDFEEKDGITVLVGNNGSGKSNVLEAVSAIFLGLFDKKKNCDFSYNFLYEINNERVRVTQEFQVNSSITLTPEQGNSSIIPTTKTHIKGFEISGNNNNIVNFLPSKIIANYSGEEERLYENFYKDFYDDFISKGIDNFSEESKMIFISKSHWEIALLTLVSSDYDLSDILGGREIKKIKIDYSDVVDSFFESKPKSIVNGFAKNLKDIGDEIDFDIFKEVAEVTHEELYKKLAISLLHKEEKNRLFKNISIIFNDNTTSSELSEGEKKQILMKFIFDFLADRDSIILLDEPDSYIHVANKGKLKNFVDKFRFDYGGEGEIMLTTHSPTLMHCFDEKYLEYLEDGKILSKDKSEVLQQISGDTMSFAQQQIVLNTNKDILLVEGKTDEMYIKAALEKLKPENSKYNNLDFEFICVGGADGMKLMVEKFTPKEEQTIIAFLDNDDAGKKAVKGISGSELTQEFLKIKNIFISLYPKKTGFTENLGKGFVIEDYFEHKKFTDFMLKDVECFQDIPQKNKRKTDFSEACKDFDPADFEGFKKLFDLILEIKNKKNETK